LTSNVAGSWFGNEKAEALGNKGFLKKPIVMSDLAKTIREVLDDK